MKKIHRSDYEGLLEKAKKTYGESLLITPDEVIRLEHPEKFPTNLPRLYNKLADRCDTAMFDLSFILHHLPPTYKHKTLSNYNFDTFIQHLLRTAVDIEEKDKRIKSNKKKQEEISVEESINSYALAASMLNHSLSFIINSMPDELRDSLKREIYPFLLMVNGISNFTNRTTKNQFILSIPHSIVPPEHKSYSAM